MFLAPIEDVHDVFGVGRYLAEGSFDPIFSDLVVPRVEAVCAKLEIVSTSNIDDDESRRLSTVLAGTYIFVEVEANNVDLHRFSFFLLEDLNSDNDRTHCCDDISNRVEADLFHGLLIRR